MTLSEIKEIDERYEFWRSERFRPDAKMPGGYLDMLYNLSSALHAALELLKSHDIVAKAERYDELWSNVAPFFQEIQVKGLKVYLDDMNTKMRAKDEKIATLQAMVDAKPWPTCHCGRMKTRESTYYCEQCEGKR